MSTAAGKVLLGEQLAAAMDARGWGVADVSDATGIPRPRIEDVLDGAGSPDLSDLLRVATALGLRVVAVPA